MMKTTRRRFLAAAAALPLVGLLGRTQAAGFPNDGSPLGNNLAWLNYWTSAWPFVDLMKISRPWQSQRPDGGDAGALDLDARGWVRSLAPNQWANTAVYTFPSSHPLGQHVLLYDGQGTFQFPGNTVVSQASGRVVVDVQTPRRPIVVQLTATNPVNPARNIRLILPGCEATYQAQVFHPLFLDRLALFRVLRFKDWMRTDGSIVTNWNDRARVDDATQGDVRGVAPEYIVQLCNRLHADAWLCIPHAADDGYVGSLAALVRDQMDPTLKIYLEYSNETWNGAAAYYPQTHYASQQGLALGLSTDPNQAGLRFHARRAVEIFAIWEQAFGGRSRLVRVLSAQFGNPWTGQQVVSWQNAYQHADALAVAPYFGGRLGQPQNAATTRLMSVDQLLDACVATIRDSTNGLAAAMAMNKTTADARGLQLVAYEAGNELVGSGPAADDDQLNALFLAAQRHPRMRDVYRELFDMWRGMGGGMLVNFNDVRWPTKYGASSLLEEQDQDPSTAPKYLAARDYVGTTAPGPLPTPINQRYRVYIPVNPRTHSP